MKILYEVLKIMIGLVSGAILVTFFNVNFNIIGNQSNGAISISYSDLATINLTAATLVLGGVALIVAVAAVFGFQVIRTESVSNAEVRVKNELPKMLKRELGKMEKDGRLTQALERALYSGGSRENNNDSNMSEE